MTLAEVPCFDSTENCAQHSLKDECTLEIVLGFDPTWKQENQGLSLSWTQVNSASGQINVAKEYTFYTYSTVQQEPSCHLWNLYFMKLIFELDILSISNLIFTAYVACKNQVQNRQKIKFISTIKLKNQCREIVIFKNLLQIDRR